jgi:RNA polymerase sigma factor (TIGR02999 family)
MQIIEFLQRVHEGDREAPNTVIPLVYKEFKKVAAGHLARQGKARRLETTALVHESFMRLAQGQYPSCESRSHFYGIVSRLMRQVLVDLARARASAKQSAMEKCQSPRFRTWADSQTACCCGYTTHWSAWLTDRSDDGATH